MRIVVVLPDLLGTYGDAGNARVLQWRLHARGIEAEVLWATAAAAQPRQGDIYVLGGAEDAAQSTAARLLAQDGALLDSARRGAVILAICAGFQLLGQSFAVAGGGTVPGLGLLDAHSTAGSTRAVGDLLVTDAALPEVGSLIGFENHLGRTTLGPGLLPLGEVGSGIGNGSQGSQSGGDGAVQGHIVGSYLHGPVLAVNPRLADRLLGWVVGPLATIDDSWAEAARVDRMAAIGRHAAGAQRRERYRWLTLPR